MNSRSRSLLIAAAAASLVAFAQAQSSSGQSSTGPSTSTGANSSSSTASPSSSQNSSSLRSGTSSDRSQSVTSSTQGSGSGSVGVTAMQRVSKDALDEQLTAKALIGKDVHDSSGEKIGEVEDIVLDASGVPELASAFMNREAERNDRSTTRPAGATSARGVDSYAAGAAGDGASVTARPDTDTGRADIGGRLGSAVASAMSGGPAAIISAGGVMGLGQDLIRVPLSQLRYNAAENHVTLDVSRDQLSRITDSDAEDASRRVAE